MSDQPYDRGGFIPGGPIRVHLHPDECVVRFEDDQAVCVRADHNHRDCQRAEPGEAASG